MYQNKRLDLFENELKEELKALLRESDEAWSHLLQSSRATLTLLVAVAALIVSTMFNEMDRLQSQETETRLRKNIEKLKEERDAWKDKYIEGRFEELKLPK